MHYENKTVDMSVNYLLQDRIQSNDLDVEKK